MQIEPNEIHIWSANLAITPEQQNKKITLLSKDEQERAKRFHFAIHGKRFIAARSMLREILSLYLTIAPQDIAFTYGENEKPCLLTPTPMALQFNLSHSENLAIYAITMHYDIGIDIEKIQDSYNADVAERFFSPQENRELQNLPSEDRCTGFYRLWSRKEAIVKATGKGLAALSAFSVSASDLYETIVLNQNESWSLLPLSIHNEYQSAVATNQPVKKIWYWSFFEHSSRVDKVTVL